MALAVLSDAPVGRVGDRLQFQRYVDPLISLLTNPLTETPFTIGILGAWGSGKSSILRMLNDELAEHHGKTFVRVAFNPWVHRREPNMLVPLLHAFRDTLMADPMNRFGEAVTAFSAVLGTLAADALLSTITAGRLTLEKIDQAKARYVEQRQTVESELRQLRSTLAREIEGLNDSGIRFVVFVDDIDRCEPDEIVSLLESIKLFLDVPGVFVVLAIAKDLVDRGVALKYHNFGFEPDRMLDIGDEYMEKMIQLPLYLLPLDPGNIRQLLAGLADPGYLAAHGDLLESMLAPNPRKIKRVLNFLSVTLTIAQHTPGLERLKPDLLLRLAVLRVQSPRLFAEVLIEPRVLVALEKVYQGQLTPGRIAFQDAFGDEGGFVLAAVTKYHRSQPYLAALFAASTFAGETTALPGYLTMFGGAAQ